MKGWGCGWESRSLATPEWNSMWKTPLQNCQRFLCRFPCFHRDVKITCDKLCEVGVAVHWRMKRLWALMFWLFIPWLECCNGPCLEQLNDVIRTRVLVWGLIQTELLGNWEGEERDYWIEFEGTDVRPRAFWQIDLWGRCEGPCLFVYVSSLCEGLTFNLRRKIPLDVTLFACKTFLSLRDKLNTESVIENCLDKVKWFIPRLHTSKRRKHGS